MKKRILAISMILVLATAGLFAAYTVALPTGEVKATLKATIGEYMFHGFDDDGVLYQPTITIENAFDSPAPSFTYGYMTNAKSGSFNFKMTVGDFIRTGGGGTVAIKTVESTKTVLSQVGRVYGVLAHTGDGKATSDSTTITITPHLDFVPGAVNIEGVPITAAHTVNGAGTVAGAAAGDYIASITFAISAS